MKKSLVALAFFWSLAIVEFGTGVIVAQFTHEPALMFLCIWMIGISFVILGVGYLTDRDLM